MTNTHRNAYVILNSTIILSEIDEITLIEVSRLLVYDNNNLSIDNITILLLIFPVAAGNSTIPPVTGYTPMLMYNGV